MHPTRFLFEILAAAIFFYFWFRPGPKRRRNRFRRKVRKGLRRVSWRKVAVGLLLILVVIPGLGGYVSATLRYLPSLLEAHKLRLTYGTAAWLGGMVAPESIPAAIESEAARHGLEPALVRAILQAESSGNPLAVSRTGAMGLMQLMPGTFYAFGWGNPFRVEKNISAGCRYLRRMLSRFDNRPRLAIAAYHAGPSAVARCQCVPQNGQTPPYVNRVAALYREYGGRQRF